MKLILLCLLSTIALDAFAKTDTLEGILRADVVRVIDGDSLRVKIQIWPGLTQEITVRLSNIDAPEIRRSRCSREEKTGHLARARLEELAGDAVWLKNIHHGKYAGRVIADVYTGAGADISQILLQEKLALPSWEGQHNQWCQRISFQSAPS